MIEGAGYVARCRAYALRQEIERLKCEAAFIKRQREDAELWQRRVATNPERWAEIHANYTSKKLKKKKAEFRKQADHILSLDFNINGERYDF